LDYTLKSGYYKRWEFSMQIDSPLFRAMQAVSDDPLCERIFHVITEAGGKAAGWAVAKRLGEDPEKLKEGFAKLTRLRVLQGTDPGLDGFYFLTELGVRLRSQLVGN